ncbi:cell division protein FtsZ [Acetobacter farinalis]|uniref:Cell division protein FtsZ n=1 Tax=Acetobacter farinalis TaxID=1260984 RepID=A0ABT3Q6T9_9PROT|nr:cell division protein FtsZ [Acetobacter farinalis]MCX2560994.1 cell division protein FtsZ [Acetobacter farinalis]NHO29756.1 cell division protein FtsZ [Acetobacter farinalis]
MTLNLTVPPQTHADFSPKITVFGVGGGGTNAVDNMIASSLQGVEFVVANTDAQSLAKSRADRRVQLGPHLTHGLGAGAKPEVGRGAAEEAADELARYLDGCHMVFITTGMGGGTGTGAAPVIARMARERNILTVGVVSKPFDYEGKRRARVAEEGIKELQQYVDTLIVIPNQNLFRVASERTTLREAYKMADHVLYMGVRGVTDLMMAPGYINLDFADIRSVMAEMGKAMMGTGEAEGENRAVEAAEAAIANPLLEDTCMSGAQGLLVNVTGGEDMTFFEVDEACNRIRREVAEDANMIFGSIIDENMNGKIRVSVVATGIDIGSQGNDRPHLMAVETEAPTEQQTLATGTGPSVMANQAQPAPTMQQPAPAAPRYDMGGMGMQQPPQQPRQAAPAAQAYQPQPQPAGQHASPPPAHSLPSQMNTAPAAAAQAQPQPQRPAASPRAGLFTEAPRSPYLPDSSQPSSRSLFGRVTGAFRRTGAPDQHNEPAMDSHPMVRPVAQGPSVRPADTDDTGLEIPTFLRRQ